MIAVDASILVYAHRAETPQHEAARAALAELAEGGEFVAIPTPAIAGFLRLVTNGRIFTPMTTLGHATGAIDDLLEPDNIRLRTPGPPSVASTAAMGR